MVVLYLGFQEMLRESQKFKRFQGDSGGLKLFRSLHGASGVFRSYMSFRGGVSFEKNNIHYTVLFLIWIILYTECIVNSIPAVCRPLQSPFLWKISEFSRVHTTH